MWKGNLTAGVGLKRNSGKLIIKIKKSQVNRSV